MIPFAFFMRFVVQLPNLGSWLVTCLFVSSALIESPYRDLTLDFLAMQQSAFRSHPLSALPVGTRARIVEIRGGRELVRKLLALGLRLGSEIRIEHHRGRGLVVSAGASRVALGGGIVEKLLVMPLDSGDEDDPSDATDHVPA